STSASCRSWSCGSACRSDTKRERCAMSKGRVEIEARGIPCAPSARMTPRPFACAPTTTAPGLIGGNDQVSCKPKTCDRAPHLVVTLPLPLAADRCGLDARVLRAYVRARAGVNGCCAIRARPLHDGRAG